jgi:hypothetical protein
MLRTQGKQMSNARIDRMVRELNSEPSVQFFQSLFGLIGLGEPPVAAKVQARESDLSFSRLENSAAR